MDLTHIKASTLNIGDKKMNRRITLLSFLIMVAAFAAITASSHPTSTVALGNKPSANGHGNLTISGELRTFSFHAMTSNDGTVKGNSALHNRDLDVFSKMDINCLSVAGNTASMSGPITHHSDSYLVGRTGVFQVVDNGEGSNGAPDEISLVFVLPVNSTSDCNT